MRRSDAEDLYNYWSDDTFKVFKYVQEFIPNDYMCVKKTKGDVLVIEQNTSRTLKELDKDIFINLICKEELIYQPNESVYGDVKNLKTGGCNMGCWILGKDASHDPSCAVNAYKGWRY